MSDQEKKQNPPLGKPVSIKYWADFQLEWDSLIPCLPSRRYQIFGVDSLSVPGDAPKDFILDCEYRPGHRSRRQRREAFIAKLGSKFYPNESITEQLITRIGQIYGLKIADSKLRIIDGHVRFMSKFFRNLQRQVLTHGAEIYEMSLGKENYSQIRDKKLESTYFTFQMTEEAIREAFPNFARTIMGRYVEMLTFDALIGHNDRHPYNWGILAPIQITGAPQFSPVFDTARALFWNVPETRVQQMITDHKQLENYIEKCDPPIGWDGEPDVNFFHLISLIWLHMPHYRKGIELFEAPGKLENVEKMLNKEFGPLMSAARRELIKRCLRIRRQRIFDMIGRLRENRLY